MWSDGLKRLPMDEKAKAKAEGERGRYHFPADSGLPQEKGGVPLSNELIHQIRTYLLNQFRRKYL